jgi:hypothetical protein
MLSTSEGIVSDVGLAAQRRCGMRRKRCTHADCCQHGLLALGGNTSWQCTVTRKLPCSSLIRVVGRGHSGGFAGRAKQEARKAECRGRGLAATICRCSQCSFATLLEHA